MPRPIPAAFALSTLSAVLLLAAARPALAQEVTAPPNEEMTALDARVTRFLEAVSMGQPRDAYTELLTGSPLLKQEKALAQLVEQTTKLAENEKYGPYRQHERVGLKTVGRDLALLRYLYKCENYPVVWHFTFYRTASSGSAAAPSWRVIIVRFDTDLELLEYSR